MTERSESERAELVAIAGQIDIFIKYGTNAIFEPDDAKKIASALRSLAAQDQKPVAWQWNTVGTWHTVDFRECEDPEKYARSFGYPVRAIYLSPPPAAGWEETDAHFTDDQLDTMYEASKHDAQFVGSEIRQLIGDIRTARAALRHNAPPDDATKSVEVLGVNAIDPANIPKQPVSGAPNSPAGHVMPDHGGADAGVDPLLVVTYTNYRGETSVRRIAPKSIRFGSTEWHPEPQWLLLAHDTEKQADREFALKDFGAKPAPVDANASAEARLREALEPFASYQMVAVGFNGALTKDDLKGCTWVAGFTGPQPEFRHFRVANEALSAHPHASDCDKQIPVPEGLQRAIDDTRAAMDRELSNLPKLVCPSDRTADDLPAIRSANDWDKQGER